MQERQGKKFKFMVNGKMRWFGETDTKTGEIKINKKRAKKVKQLGVTIYHEKIHSEHPKMHEKTVYKKEKNFKNLGKKAKSRLYDKVKKRTKGHATSKRIQTRRRKSKTPKHSKALHAR